MILQNKNTNPQSHAIPTYNLSLISLYHLLFMSLLLFSPHCRVKIHFHMASTISRQLQSHSSLHGPGYFAGTGMVHEQLSLMKGLISWIEFGALPGLYHSYCSHCNSFEALLNSLKTSFWCLCSFTSWLYYKLSLSLCFVWLRWKGHWFSLIERLMHFRWQNPVLNVCS